ncbi:MAG: GDSL-type esterase/lipase family protein [Mycobacteriales bacterium]
MLLRLITALLALLLVVTPLLATYSDETGVPDTSVVGETGTGSAPIERPGASDTTTPPPVSPDPREPDPSAPAPPAPSTPSTPPQPEGPPAPSSMAALGDSITKGFNACGLYFDCEARSWSTGDSAEVSSHYVGLRELNPAIEGKNFNDAKSGAVAADMAGQAEQAVGQQVEYITLLVGANDACRPSEGEMTPVSAYSDQINTALTAIKSGLPSAKVFIASIPDVKRVWETSRNNVAARTAWSVGSICQSMLANPTSDAPADNERRDRVWQRVVDYNTALAQLCSTYGPNCVFDGNAVFDHDFPARLLSNFDFFHPNGDGQAELARITRAAGFQWSTSPDTVLA